MASPSSMTQIPQQQGQGQGQEEQNQDQKQRHSNLHTWASSTLLVLVLLTLVGCLVIWFKVHPMRLQYTVEKVLIHDFAISSILNQTRNVSDERLHSTFVVVVSTYNPNHRIMVNYESIDMSVEYHGQVLAVGPMEHFVQSNPVKYLFNSTVTATNVKLLSNMAEDLKMIKNSTNPIKVDVKMRARAIFVVPHWAKDHRKLKIVCQGVPAHFSASTMLEKTGCYVDF